MARRRCPRLSRMSRAFTVYREGSWGGGGGAEGLGLEGLSPTVSPATPSPP